MSNIDERIRQALAVDELESFDRIDTDATLFQTIADTFHGKNRRLVVMVYIFTTIFAGLMFWTGYRFFTAVDQTEMVYYGISMLACMIVVTGHKQWSWMEMNRVTLMRALKQLELQLAVRQEMDSGSK